MPVDYGSTIKIAIKKSLIKQRETLSNKEIQEAMFEILQETFEQNDIPVKFHTEFYFDRDYESSTYRSFMSKMLKMNTDFHDEYFIMKRDGFYDDFDTGSPRDDEIYTHFYSRFGEVASNENGISLSGKDILLTFVGITS